MKQFKEGDKVYYPNFGTSVFTLSKSYSDSYPLRITVKDDNETFSINGQRYFNSNLPAIFEATEENRELLSKLYGQNFKKNESFLDKHLRLGSKVLCLVTKPSSQILPTKVWEIDTSNSMIELITGKTEEGNYKNSDGKYILKHLDILPIAVDSKGVIKYLSITTNTNY